MHKHPFYSQITPKEGKTFPGSINMRNNPTETHLSELAV